MKDPEWEKFYAEYRDESPAPEELIDLIGEIAKHTKPEEIDTSDNVCVVLPANEFEDILDFLTAVSAPLPAYVATSPMHADPKEMGNRLNSIK